MQSSDQVKVVHPIKRGDKRQKRIKIYLLTLIDYCYRCPWVLVAQKPASVFYFQSDRCQIPHGSGTDGEIRERFEREKMHN